MESFTPAGAERQVSSMTTTPTDTGPASAPRPTSSIPASRRWPWRCRARSTRREGLVETVRAAITCPCTAGFPDDCAAGTLANVADGSPSQLRSDSGQTTLMARPTMRLSGTEPSLPSPPRGWKRESEESERWSPMTQTRPGRHGDVEGLQARRVAGLEVGLVDRHAVDLERAALPVAGDVVAGQADDPLDQVVALVGGQQPDERQGGVERRADRAALRGRHRVEPVVGVLEHDDVTAVEVERAGCQLADDHPVALDEGVLHRAGGDVEGLQQPGLDDQREQQRHADDDDGLAQHRAHGRATRGAGCWAPPAAGRLTVVTVPAAASASRSGHRRRGGWPGWVTLTDVPAPGRVRARRPARRTLRTAPTRSAASRSPSPCRSRPRVAPFLLLDRPDAPGSPPSRCDGRPSARSCPPAPGRRTSGRWGRHRRAGRARSPTGR